LADEAGHDVDALKAHRSGRPNPATPKGELKSRAEKFAETGPFKSLAHFSYAVKQAGERPGYATAGPLAEWRAGAVEDEAGCKALFGDAIKSASGMSEFADADGG